ncbi:PspA/IM30 family protein [Anoxybacteroides tepidamans]|uniref:PspA/IM30 family protein n=1 Tax=Anoxybacteroides tepidamans TaxID=265948 RepID=UPI000487C886|nr:PspA/IM30 family protein [Anoxybacillus tepidamans]
MSLFTRIKNVIAADLHELLDEKEKKNPIAMLNQYLRQCEQETEKVRKLVERQHLLKEEFLREYHHASHLAEKRKKQAEIASRAGEQELYEFAVQEQAQYEQRALQLKESYDKAGRDLVELEKKYEEMKHKLKDMHIRRMELMGRENMAHAHYRINHVLENTGTTAAYSTFKEIESYLERLEQQVVSAYYRNTIDARIAQLEKQLASEESLPEK